MNTFVQIILAIGFLAAGTSPLIAQDCDLTAFTKNPTRSEARSLVRAGEACHSPLQTAYAQSTDENFRLLTLKIIVASNHLSSESETFLKTLTTSDREPGINRLIAGLVVLLNNPTDVGLQDSFLESLEGDRVPWNEIDLAFYNERGLSVLEELIERFDSISSDSANKLVHLTSVNFPAELDELLVPQVEKLTETVLTQKIQEASESQYKIGYAVEAVKDREWKANYIAELISDTTLNEAGLVREALVSSALISVDFMIADELEDQIAAFYFNDETGVSAEEETNEHFNLRRSRLLNFVEVVHALQRLQRVTDLAAKSWVRDNAEFIALSNMSEFQVGVMGFVRKLDDPQYIVDSLLSSDNAKVIKFGLRLMREVPATYWDSHGALRERVTGLTQFGFPVVPEDVRVEAAATARYLSRDRLDMAPLLAGLSSPSEDVRLSTMRLMRESKDGSVATLRGILRVLRQDPAPAVRVEALGLVYDQLERQSAEPNAFVYSRPLGIALLSQWKHTHEELLEAAQQALERYLEVSPHASGVIIEGIRSGEKAISAKAFASSQAVMRSEATELGKLLSVVRGTNTENHLAPFEAFGNLTELSSLIYEVIKANYQPGQLMDSFYRSSRLAELLRHSNSLVKELKKYEADPDPEVRKRVEEALDELRKSLN